MMHGGCRAVIENVELRMMNKLSQEQRTQISNDLISFCENELDHRIGIIGAGELLDFFLKSAGKEIYNKGLSDAKRAISDRVNELNYDIDDLIE